MKNNDRPKVKMPRVRKEQKINNPQRKFKGIFIPAEIWLSNKISMQEKLFYVEIDSLDNEDGCYASNEHFANFFGITKTRVSRVIAAMVEKKLISSVIDNTNGSRRVLRIIYKFSEAEPCTKVQAHHSTKVQGGIVQKYKGGDNKSTTPIIGITNTSINTDSINTPETKKSEINYSDRPHPKTDTELQDKIFEYLSAENDIAKEARRSVFEQMQKTCKKIQGKGLRMNDALYEVIGWWAMKVFAKNKDLNMTYSGFVGALKSELYYYDSYQPEVKASILKRNNIDVNEQMRKEGYA